MPAPLIRRCLPCSLSTVRWASRHSKRNPSPPTVDLLRGFEYSLSQLESLRHCQMEFNSGAGGTEAMLFVSDLMQMYAQFARRQPGWKWRELEVDTMSKGGVRSAIVSVEGPLCYSTLRFEGGVHRVQRVPVTDTGRVHTSTASIVVMPEMENPELELSKRDVREEIMRSSGAGGANVNAKSTAVRLVHVPSGVSVKCQEERYVEENRKRAFRRLGAILLQRRVDQLAAQVVNARRVQVTSLDRAEKIRTYNYKDKRVTDHRLRLTLNGVLDDYMQGGEALDRMIDAVQEAHLREMEAAEAD